MPRVWHALIAKAAHGDIPAQKLYFELKERYAKKTSAGEGAVIIIGEDEIAM